MTEQELINRQLEYGNKLFVVTKSGNFFSAYDYGAFALARATGYRVMRRQRKGGRQVLTTGFPASRLEHVLEQIEAAGGSIEERSESHFLFSGIDGNEEEGLIHDQPRPDTGSRKPLVPQPDSETLEAMLLSFDLSHSTPMEAMLFIDKLQKELRKRNMSE